MKNQCPSAFEEVESKDWTEKVYKPDILGKPDTIYKAPGYDPHLADAHGPAAEVTARCRSASTKSVNAAEDWRRLG